jgi:hypothetical protein
MHRIVIAPPVEVLERIRDIAATERRTPKEQIEWILINHVREHADGQPEEPAEEVAAHAR